MSNTTETKKQYCSICGKEKPQYYIEYINKYVYVKCECEKQMEAEENEKKRKKAIETYINLRGTSSYVQLRDKSADLSTLTVNSTNKTAVNIARHIAKMLIENDEQNQKKNGLILKGNRGSGKTYIACAIINEINKKAPLNEWTIKKIINEIDNGFGSSLSVLVGSQCKIIKEDELLRLYNKYEYHADSDALDEFRKAKKLLVIDDLGTASGDPKKIQSAYFNIIDYRYSNMLPTIITTNKTNQELLNYLGERTYDRLNSCCYNIPLTSEESWRGN